jgi:hypothetical protein
MVVAFAAGSGFQPWIKRLAAEPRWIILALVCAAALVDAGRRLLVTRSLPPQGLLRFGVLAGSFLAVAAVSTGWSVSPRLTFERAGSLGILFVLGAALATSTARDVAARIRLFQGLGAGAIAVGVLGVLVLVFDYDVSALHGPGTWRYRGFTENPNTIAVLAAVALPLVLGLALRPVGRRRRAAWLGGGLLLLASLIASESRGGLLAACAGTLLVVAFGVEGVRHRAAAVAALVLVFAGGFALRETVQPPTVGFSSTVAPAPPPPPAPTVTTPKAGNQKPGTPTGNGSKHGKPASKPPKPKPRPQPTPTSIAPLVSGTSELPREVDEIGHPALSKESTSTLASGRIAAWKGALDLIRDRPILGYGFGTEQKVFIDRWYYFQGGATENSYLGLLLQVGIVGLALIVAMGSVLLAGGFAAVRVRRGDEQLTVLMALGVLVAAGLIMLIQSYLYSVGNVATATVWISLFALAPVALAPRVAAKRVRATAPEGAA